MSISVDNISEKTFDNFKKNNTGLGGNSVAHRNDFIPSRIDIRQDGIEQFARLME